MVTSPQVSWLFFKAVRAGLAVKRPYLSHTGRASNAEKQPTGRGPEGCVENGPAAALLVGYVSIKICALLAPCRRPILNATTSPLYARRYTRRRSVQSSRWDGAIFLITPGTSCLATISLSLRDKSRSPSSASP